MTRNICFVSMLIGLSFGANAQDVFNLSVNSFESYLKKFLDAKYQPEIRCENFLDKRQKLNSLSLYIGAVHCTRQNQLMDAAKLLAMADVKFQFDQIRYPVTSQDKNALMGVGYIRSQAFSLYGNESIYVGQSDADKIISHSVTDWNIDFTKKESPGWQHSEAAISNQELKKYWINFKNIKISEIDSVKYFLSNPELTRAKNNWTAASKSLSSGRSLPKPPHPDANPYAAAIVQVMEQHEKTTSEVYRRMLNEMDDAKRPYIDAFEKSINIRDLMEIDPITLNPIDDVRGNISFSFVSPSVREFKFNLDNIQPVGHSVDVLHFMSFCIADLIVRSTSEFKGWQIGTNQQDFSRLKFRVKLLKSDSDVSREDDYKFSDPMWLPNENFKQTCRFIRRGYFRNKS
jgi:hypothetical protein